MRSLFSTAKGHVIQAIGAPVAGAGVSSIISMQDDVIRILGITLANWSLIIAVCYSVLQIALAIHKHKKEKKEKEDE